MNDQWQRMQERYEALNAELVQPSIDSQRRLVLQKELSLVSSLLEQKKRLDALELEIQQADLALTQVEDPQMKELFVQELIDLQAQRAIESNKLEDLLYPPDELDNRDVYLEIRAGAGGQEAALFAADLMRMYKLYAEKKHWRVSVEDMSATDLGGIREVVMHIKGTNVYGHLKHESGVHRVQRVPATETQGRVHTSTATVAVLPEAQEVEVQINPADLRIDVFRASGAGGQHVNTTDSAVRITHVPTGVVVSCQDERSQHKNKAKAMKILQSRILAVQTEEKEAKMSAERKQQVGTGMRAEKVRTYNFPQNRVTDHQVDVTLKNLDMVMEGNMDGIIEPLLAMGREQRKSRTMAKLG